MAKECINIRHEWSRWYLVKDEKGRRWRRHCLRCGRKDTRRKPTVQAIFDVLRREIGILGK